MSEKPTLQFLPGEILQLIHSSLPLGSKLALSMTCKRFYNSFFETIPASYLTDPVRRREFEKVIRNQTVLDEFKIYDFCRSRELCGFKPSRKLICCDRCQMRHLPLFFHPNDRGKPVTERTCVKHTRGFWIEPGKCFSFADLADPGRPARIYKMRTPRSITIGEESNCYTPRYLLWTHYDILTLPVHMRASKEQIAKILNGFDLPTCPHVRLGDSVIMQHYYCNTPRINTVAEPLDQRYPPFFDPVDLRTKCTFPSCLTSFCWTEHASAEHPGWRTVYLHVLRKVRFNAAFDRAWMVQLMTPNESLLERHWEDCFRWKTEMLAIQKERYENEAGGSRKGNGNGNGSNHKQYLAREAQLRQREEIVNTLFHPRRSQNYPDIVRRLEGTNTNLSSVTGDRNRNGPDTISAAIHRPWTPPTTPIVTSENIRDIVPPIQLTPKQSDGAVFMPFITEEDSERYNKRETAPGPVEGQKNPTSWFGRLFKLAS
ncbi:hypothetical protein EMCG_03658 [[Emmonsia] crescens]|uniref:F-box domain-containing protein n=1 Tax=[Emmonsia] crescens TaxID=73230 RepID=A0A0G2HUW0_9EURO|nr:hypothetical protein EMCG_03658 [Emmonsia crescens UAMH 3008]